jgi:hypothetical protein
MTLWILSIAITVFEIDPKTVIIPLSKIDSPIVAFHASSLEISATRTRLELRTLSGRPR